MIENQPNFSENHNRSLTHFDIDRRVHINGTQSSRIDDTGNHFAGSD